MRKFILSRDYSSFFIIYKRKLRWIIITCSISYIIVPFSTIIFALLCWVLLYQDFYFLLFPCLILCRDSSIYWTYVWLSWKFLPWVEDSLNFILTSLAYLKFFSLWHLSYSCASGRPHYFHFIRHPAPYCDLMLMVFSAAPSWDSLLTLLSIDPSACLLLL
jgi:hypothetical protein